MATLGKSIMYSELVCQTNYSFLHGASHPEEMIEKACLLKYSAIAITDECSVSGVVRAYAHIKKFSLNIHLIVGARFTYKEQLNIVMICPNRKAYAELCRIITNSRKRCKKGEYELLDWDLSSVRHCFVIWLPKGDSKQDSEHALWLKKLYGSRLYIGLQRLLKDGEVGYIKHCEQISEIFNLNIIACGGSLMHDKNRLPLQHTLQAIKKGISVHHLGANSLPNSEYALRPISTITKLYPDQYIQNAIHVANECTFSLSQLKYEYPSELIPKNKTPIQYLKELVRHGINKRFKNKLDTRLKDILSKELKLIEEMKYEHFFITIYDIIQFAQKKNILYQGRGSAANSVVCYCLEITSVDPKQIDVLFERFISKERKEPPDIDVDFEHHRREEVFQYIYAKYGTNHTAITATIVTYRLKSAIKEVGKALGMNVTQLEFFIKNINRRDAQTSWSEQIAELGLSPKSYKAQQFISLVNQIRGFPRHLSQHVGGFIISSGPLYELVPVENAAMANRTVIQWDKDDLETLELLKVDILALGMLTAIRQSFDLIKKHYQHTLSIADISKLQDDPQVYRLIQKADTVGIFQIESRAQMSMLPRLLPNTFYDLVIQIAIVRPGPIQGKMVHPFLKRREGIEPLDYPSEEIKEVLKRTMGVPIFQEQVIKIAMVAAGFSGGEADQLRRSMGKWKYNGEMEQFRQKLINGMLEKNYTLDFAERLFEQILGFGDYGFPESHSASFAILAYVSAWLKCYFPEVFYCSLLNSYPMGFYSPSQLLQDAQKNRITINPVCVNNSNWEHKLEVINKHDFAIRLGLKSVKGMSETTAKEIINNRNKRYTHVDQLKSLRINKLELQALASANAYNSFSKNRYDSRWSLLNSHSELPLFQDLSLVSDYKKEPSNFENLTEDYASLGFSLKHHPIALLRDNNVLGSYTPADQLMTKQHKTIVTVVGVVTGRQSPGSASGVTFMTLEDDTGNTNVIVWMATARAQKKNFLSAKVVKVKGIIEKEKEVIHIVAGKIIDITEKLEELNISSRDFR